MKLAEALLLRADIQKKVASLRDRITRYAVVQEGDAPAEDPQKLLGQVAGALDRLESLVFQINRANLENKLADGRTLTAAMAARDALLQRHSIYQAAISGSAREPDRYGLKEVKWVHVLDVASLQKQSDDLSKQVRVINAAIQEANWKTEVAVEE
jgi:hypothetical protein